jgi:hypothetical protein
MSCHIPLTPTGDWEKLAIKPVTLGVLELLKVSQRNGEECEDRRGEERRGMERGGVVRRGEERGGEEWRGMERGGEERRGERRISEGENQFYSGNLTLTIVII